MEERKERYLLVGIDTGEGDAEASLDELEELLKTAGGETAGRVIQPRDKANPATYVGKGKVDELREYLSALEADGILTDDELTPSQMKNLEDALDTKVVDRTMLILDIFAGRATTREGKLQVELAQLKYRMTRLLGSGKQLSRLGGGIGTRGPGESKLESDRRVIKNRIMTLRAEADDLVRHREIARRSRKEHNVPVVAIVGYTNAGKSTLLNRIAGSSVLSEDKLFATLDPTTRSVRLPGGETVLFTDTVGFINKLPHHLVDAFRSTLEEAKYADVILHVIDGSNRDHMKQRDVVYQTMDELQIAGKPIVTAYNKWDRVTDGDVCASHFPVKDERSEKTLKISALTGDGIEEMLKSIEEVLLGKKHKIEVVFPFSDAGKLTLIRTYGTILKEEYAENGICVEAYVTDEIAGKLGLSGKGTN